MARGDYVHFIGGQFVQIFGDDVTKGHHDFTKITLCRFIHSPLIGYIQITGSDVGAKKVAAEENSILFQVGDHGFRPMHPGGMDKPQRLVTQ